MQLEAQDFFNILGGEGDSFRILEGKGHFDDDLRHFGATKSAQVKIGAGQNHRHRSESAQKKSELTLLYSA